MVCCTVVLKQSCSGHSRFKHVVLFCMLPWPSSCWPNTFTHPAPPQAAEPLKSVPHGVSDVDPIGYMHVPGKPMEGP